MVQASEVEMYTLNEITPMFPSSICDSYDMSTWLMTCTFRDSGCEFEVGCDVELGEACSDTKPWLFMLFAASLVRLLNRARRQLVYLSQN
jgi:hypothetical protein